eukprot:TRINITY_DN24833_c0_g1_i1.p1 TRINITY_DN24833_c0_g1~~TRINITY_DN24833_c0_g1_i1.p1  ORF type:complete len:591 (+),score=127.93 TRINITY_DN24833_c0_g1_i1:67-1773(+)
MSVQAVPGQAVACSPAGFSFLEAHQAVMLTEPSVPVSVPAGVAEPTAAPLTPAGSWMSAPQQAVAPAPRRLLPVQGTAFARPARSVSPMPSRSVSPMPRAGGPVVRAVSPIRFQHTAPVACYAGGGPGSYAPGGGSVSVRALSFVPPPVVPPPPVGPPPAVGPQGLARSPSPFRGGMLSPGVPMGQGYAPPMSPTIRAASFVPSPSLVSPARSPRFSSANPPQVLIPASAPHSLSLPPGGAVPMWATPAAAHPGEAPSVMAASAGAVSFVEAPRTLPVVPLSPVLQNVQDPQLLALQEQLRSQQQQLQLQLNQMRSNAPRQSLLRGFPDPAVISEQKASFSKNLDKQLSDGERELREQNRLRKSRLQEAAEQQKAQLALQVDQQTKLQEMALDEETSRALMGLKKSALDQRAALEQQAARLTLEYQTRKMHEEYLATQAEMQKQYHETHAHLHSNAQRSLAQDGAQVLRQESTASLGSSLASPSPRGSTVEDSEAVPSGSVVSAAPQQAYHMQPLPVQQMAAPSYVSFAPVGPHGQTMLPQAYHQGAFAAAPAPAANGQSFLVVPARY